MPGLVGVIRNLLRKSQKQAAFPAGLIDALPVRRASALRELLKNSVLPDKPFPVEELLTQSEQAGWSSLEREKLLAYIDFFSGQCAAGYQRVMSQNLAQYDFELFMTTVTYCYLHDRFPEGYALIKKYDLSKDDDFIPGEFYPHAGLFAFAATGNMDEAIAYFDQTNEYSLVQAANAYMIYFMAEKFEQVERLRHYIYFNCTNDQVAIFALSWNELARDYYPEGFRLAESRYSLPGHERYFNVHLFSKPYWCGEPLEGKRFFVHGEQGLGDVVMMARYLPLLLEKGVAQLTMDVPHQVFSLMVYNFPECRFLQADFRKSVDAEFDFWTGSMSLPHHFKTTASTVPVRSGYLRVPPEQKRYWHERVQELSRPGALRVGVAWSGNPAHRYDRIRSIDFKLISSFIRERREIQFFSLQTSMPENVPANLANCAEEMVTMADTAALISELDLVITVDTSIVHLAGALGKNTWLLLPRRYEWRWSLEGEKNNWYESVRVIRQEKYGDWQGLLNEVFSVRLAQFSEKV